MNGTQATTRGSRQHAIRNHTPWYVWLYMAWYVHRNHHLPDNEHIAHAVGVHPTTAKKWREILHEEGVLDWVDGAELLYVWPEFDCWFNWLAIRAALMTGATVEHNLLRVYPGDGYPPGWTDKSIQQEVHDIAGWHCEHCGMTFPVGDTRAMSARNQDGKPAILTVHHLNGVKNDCRWENLLACCQACHLHIQAVWAPGQPLPLVWRNNPPEWLTDRGLDYQPNAQLVLVR
jgi:hypothetical protein